MNSHYCVYDKCTSIRQPAGACAPCRSFQTGSSECNEYRRCTPYIIPISQQCIANGTVLPRTAKAVIAQPMHTICEIQYIDKSSTAVAIGSTPPESFPSPYTFQSPKPMQHNTQPITINGGQHFQIRGDYNYHAPTQSVSSDEAAVRKRKGEDPILNPESIKLG